MTMMNPDAALARRMTAEMSARLNVAFRHLVAEVMSRPDWVDVSDPSPAAFGLQGMMRDLAVAGDLDGASALFDRLRAVLEPGSGPEALVRPLAEPAFGAAEIEVLRQGFADDIGLTSTLLPPDSEQAALVSGMVDSVLLSLARNCPDWREELLALVRQVVLASAPEGGQIFAGASAFDLWGAILVNPGRAEPMHLAMTLIHESSHLKLFYAYLDDEIVLNDPEERYSSPLRREPRPMNGLYHAAYVLARMASFAADMMEADGETDDFGPDRRELFRTEALTSVAAFDSAHEIIARQGELTAKGAAIMAEAAKAVERARQVAQAA